MARSLLLIIAIAVTALTVTPLAAQVPALPTTMGGPESWALLLVGLFAVGRTARRRPIDQSFI